MSGGVPKKIWQGRMATKTNQTGMKIQGFPSMIGRKTSNKRIISNRVNSKFVACGSGRSGWRCKHGVDGDNAGENARKKYCERVVNGVNGISCGEQQPLSRNLAGGVGNNVSNPRLRAAQGTCGTNTVSRCGTKESCNKKKCLPTVFELY